MTSLSLSNRILNEASDVVNGARNATYGSPEENHGCTALMMAAYLRRRYAAEGAIDIHIDAHDVCIFNILQKVSRLANTPAHHDSLVDIAGYAENIARLQPSTAEKDDPYEIDLASLERAFGLR